MTEYIEREALIEDFKHCGAESATINAIVYRINLHSAADVAPVVRCKDCVSGPKNPHARIFHCNVLGCGGMKPNDFCSYGKQKDGGG